MDIYSRKIVGWAIDKTMTKELVLSALKMAYKRQNLRKGVIHHSDRGVQYASYEYQKLPLLEYIEVFYNSKRKRGRKIHVYFLDVVSQLNATTILTKTVFVSTNINKVS